MTPDKRAEINQQLARLRPHLSSARLAEAEAYLNLQADGWPSHPLPVLADVERPCHGCAHSASGAVFPGHPSGERPCFFCARNVSREAWQERFEADHGRKLEVWYNGAAPAAVPMDCYHGVQMKEQIGRWVDAAVEAVKPREEG